MTDRKKPGLAFWVAVVLVGYPLSIGPAVWLQIHGWTSARVDKIIYWFYAPIGWLHVYGPGPVHDLIRWYLSLWEHP